jgi:transposase InsO family protein
VWSNHATHQTQEVFVTHVNAPLSETGRLRLARCVVERGWSLARAAERFNVSITTAKRWADRYRAHGSDGMCDRSSRPGSCPRQTPRPIERRVVGLRVSRRWGPARIAYHLRHQDLAPSTVHKILRRYSCPPLAWTDPATGVRLRDRAKPVRYVHARPGDLVHVDITWTSRSSAGSPTAEATRCSAAHTDAATGAAARATGTSTTPIHNAVDDHTRLAYSELLTDERQDTAAAFWQRANAYFTSAGITVQRVLTDNGSCYRSHAFATALGDQIKHKRTRPYRPQTNGKVERYNRTMLQEWAYARPYHSETERVASFTDWLHTYNHHRGHTALGGKSPADLVPNLCGQNS